MINVSDINNIIIIVVDVDSSSSCSNSGGINIVNETDDINNDDMRWYV